MDFFLKALDKIFFKYKNLAILVYGTIGITFMIIVIQYIIASENRIKIIDLSFLDRQIEKIKKDKNDFKSADIPYIKMVCSTHHDYISQRQCEVVNNFINNHIKD